MQLKNQSILDRVTFTVCVSLSSQIGVFVHRQARKTMGLNVQPMYVIYENQHSPISSPSLKCIENICNYKSGLACGTLYFMNGKAEENRKKKKTDM